MISADSRSLEWREVYVEKEKRAGGTEGEAVDWNNRDDHDKCC